MTSPLLYGVPRKDTIVLVDTNVIMEAVRTRCWNAVTGGLRVETVEECRDEALRGDRGRPGYLPVDAADLARIHTVHPVSAVERAAFGMAYQDARDMDRGERDLFAHAYARVSRGDARCGSCARRTGRASVRPLRWAGTSGCTAWRRSRPAWA